MEEEDDAARRTQELREREPFLRHFDYSMIRQDVQRLPRGFAWLAEEIVELTADGPDRRAALLLLLQARDRISGAPWRTWRCGDPPQPPKSEGG